MPGAYRLSVSSAAHPKRYRVVSNLEMGTQDQELDLELRGSSLTGKVLGLPADFGDRTLKIGARLEGHDFPAAVHSVEMNADRTYRFDGLGPGTWILSTWPEARTPATVVLSEDVVESAFDLVFD